MSDLALKYSMKKRAMKKKMARGGSFDEDEEGNHVEPDYSEIKNPVHPPLYEKPEKGNGPSWSSENGQWKKGEAVREAAKKHLEEMKNVKKMANGGLSEQNKTALSLNEREAEREDLSGSQGQAMDADAAKYKSDQADYANQRTQQMNQNSNEYSDGGNVDDPTPMEEYTWGTAVNKSSGHGDTGANWKDPKEDALMAKGGCLGTMCKGCPKCKPSMMAEGGMLTTDGYQSRMKPEVDGHMGSNQASGFVDHEGDVKRPSSMAMSQDSRKLNQHGDIEEGPQGPWMAEGGQIEDNMQSDSHMLDMVGKTHGSEAEDVL